MSKHTPGPWTIAKFGSTSVIANDGAVVANTGGHFTTLRDPSDLLAEQEANARLIAAAPDLLAACKALLSADHPDHFAARMSDSELAAIELIKAAVAEAKGKERAV